MPCWIAQDAQIETVPPSKVASDQILVGAGMPNERENIRIAIEEATDGDLPKLIGGLGQRYYFASRLTWVADGRGKLLVAWCGNEPVGDVYLSLDPPEEPELMECFPDTPLLKHLEVKPSWRNLGIGTALMCASEDALAELGCKQVALGVGLDNHSAIQLYLRLGYTEWPYPPIATTAEVFLEDGQRITYEDKCQIFTKPLDDLKRGAPGGNNWELAVVRDCVNSHS